MKIVATVFICAALAGCEPKPVPPAPAAQPHVAEPAAWLRIETESDDDVPASPEQVMITITTRDGKKWVASWEEQPQRRHVATNPNNRSG
jgi:hypothetical protein